MAEKAGYIGRSPSDSSTIVARQVFTPTSDTTTFTFSSGYTVGYLDAYLNGSRLVAGSGNDYVASNGSTVVLNEAAVSGDVLEVVAYKAFNAATIDNAPGNLTVGGNLTVDGTFSGDASDLTGIVTSITAGDNINVSGATGNVTITGLANTSNVVADSLVVQGISTFSGQLNGAAASFSGNVSIGGTLTYEDVTNVDSVGLITARSGIEVSGIVTARSGFAVTYYGDGSNLTGIDATSLKDSGDTIRVQANTSGAVVTGVLTTTEDLQIGTQSSHTKELRFADSSRDDASSIIVDNSDSSNLKITNDRSGASIVFATDSAERSRIDSSGRSLVGLQTSRSIGGSHSKIQVESTDSSGRLSVVQNRNEAGGCPFITLGKSRGTGIGSVTALQDDDTIGTIAFAGADGTDIETLAAQIRVQVDNTPGSNDIPGRMIFDTTADGETSPSEAMRITSLNSSINSSLDHAIWMSSGNTPDVNSTEWKLFVRGATRFYNPYDFTATSSRKGQYEFYSNSGGNSNNSDSWDDQKAAMYVTGWLESGNPGESASVLLLNGRWSGATNPGMLIKGYNYSSNFVFEVNRNGDVKNNNNSYGSLSDEQLKQDIVDAGSQWEDIKNLRVRKFKFKSDVFEHEEMGADPAVFKLGLIAQEAELVCPGLVNTPPGYGIPEQEKYKSIKYSVLYMKAVKALQEAQERIETLETTVSDLTSRITDLEGG